MQIENIKWDTPENIKWDADIKNIEPSPFDISGFVNEERKNLNVDKDVNKDFSDTIYPIVKPFLSLGVTTAKAINSGLASFSVHLDTIAEYIESKTGLQSGDIFEQAAKVYEENTEYWQKKADKMGVNFLDELLGEAIGGAPAGIAEFILNIPYASLLGAAEAEKEGQSEVAGALTEGARRGVLGVLFKAMAPLKQYLRAPLMGTVFGVESVAKGSDIRETAKAFGTGAIYSITSPGGRMGLNELKKNLVSELNFREARQKAIDKYIKIPEFKNTQEAEAFGKKATPEQVEKLKALRAESKEKWDAIDKSTDFNEAVREATRGQLYREAIETYEGTKTGKKISPTMEDIIETPIKPSERTEPLFTEEQINKRAKQKEKKVKQLAIENAELEKEQVHEMIRNRRQNINLASYETNLFINDIEKQTTREQREAVPFVIERTGVPKTLKRPDLEGVLTKDIDKLSKIAEQVKQHFDKGWQKIKENVPDMSTEQIEDYVTHIWDIPKSKKQEVTNWFVTQNRFLKKRYIATLNEGIEKFGLTPKVLDIGEIIRIHDSVTNKVIENNKFVKQLKGLKREGVSLIERADKAPQEWVYIDHPALRKGFGIPSKEGDRLTLGKMPVKVHPDLVKPLKVIFDSRFDHPVIKAYEVLNGILKKTNLSISLFHHGALGETGVAIMGPVKTAKIYFDPVKIYKAIANNEFEVYKKEPIARDAISHGLQLGASADIPVAMIQRHLNEFAAKTKDIPVVNKATEFVRTFNEVWDKALWGYLHDTLKLYAYESLVSKAKLNKDMVKQKQEISQFVNDTFGGQNWENLMVSPKSLQIMSWGLLSPDWTLSTVRQALAPTGFGKVHKETAGLRKQLGGKFWIKAGLYFGVGINLLNYAFRKWDEKENPKYYKGLELSFLDRTMIGNTIGHKTHLFVGRYEDGTERYVRWGKQFRELPEMFFDDTGFSPISASIKKVGGKMAPVLQLTAQITTGASLSGFKNDDIDGKKGWDKVAGIGKTLMKAPFPFSARTLFQDDKEFHITDIMMPSSKGMTRYKAIELFKHAVNKQDDQLLKETYQFTLLNNLPAYTLFNAAMTSLKAEATREYNDNIKSFDKALEQLPKAENITELNRLKRILNRLEKEQLDREIGLDLLDKAIMEMKVYDIKEGK